MRFSLIIAVSLASGATAVKMQEEAKPKDSAEMKKIMEAIAKNPFADHKAIYGALKKDKKGKKTPKGYPAAAPVVI